MGHLDDQHVSRVVDPIGHGPIDDAPRARAVREVEDIAELRFVNGIRRPKAAEDLGRIESAFPHAPHDSAHVPDRDTAGLTELGEIRVGVSPAAGEIRERECQGRHVPGSYSPP